MTSHEGRVAVVNECAVELREVVKSHGDTLAVDRVSLKIRRGEFFSILGPSGSGKTTTLRLVAGFETPDQGDILIEGRPVRGLPPNRRPVNLVFQHYALFPHLTVAGNVAFGLEMRRVLREDVAVRVCDALAMVKLAGKQDRYPSQLSGGEQQRVALARALVNRPAVLLLDEPLGALDQALRLEMQLELKTIQEQVGITFVCVTHHQEEALTMSDRVAVMHQGRVLQVGTPQEVYEMPAAPFVAGFIGLSNRLEGRIVSAEGECCEVAVSGLPEPLRVTARRPPRGAVGSRVVLVLRPERVHCVAEIGPERCANAVPARVVKAIYSGNEMQYLLALSDAVQWRARVPHTGGGQKRLQAGEAVTVRWNADEAIVLAE